MTNFIDYNTLKRIAFIKGTIVANIEIKMLSSSYYENREGILQTADVVGDTWCIHFSKERASDVHKCAYLPRSHADKTSYSIAPIEYYV